MMNACTQGPQEAMEQQLKSMAEKASTAENQCVRETLRERVRNRVVRAERDYRRAQRLHELGDLLDRNPEVCRILELMEEM